MQLLSKQIEDPAWNQSFARYFESLPAWETLYSKEIWSMDPDHMALLQEPYLVSTCLAPLKFVESAVNLRVSTITNCRHLWLLAWYQCRSMLSYCVCAEPMPCSCQLS